jgi:hypothetical protein
MVSVHNQREYFKRHADTMSRLHTVSEFSRVTGSEFV